MYWVFQNWNIFVSGIFLLIVLLISFVIPFLFLKIIEKLSPKTFIILGNYFSCIVINFLFLYQYFLLRNRYMTGHEFYLKYRGVFLKTKLSVG